MADSAFDEFRSRLPKPPSHLALLLQPLTLDNFAQCYFFGDTLLSGLIDDQRTKFAWGQNPSGAAAWRVELFSTDGSPVNGQTARGDLLPLHRSLAKGPLRGTDKHGKYGFNHLTCLATDKQRRGVVRALSQREEALFRAWGSDEVHLDAGCDAFKNGAWFRLGYDLALADKVQWQLWWMDYQLYELDKKEADLISLPTAFMDWAPEFRLGVKRGQQLLPLFKSL